ncbi:hypothetical protein F4805DRAFT_150609 [Annulohypoxylon moriforme]|nr:hypothetical protein F4805DRAFT_150609 [Annulohypoxylon moriforme]
MNSGTNTNSSSIRCEFLAVLDDFKKTAGLTPNEETEFQMTNLEGLQNCIRTIQHNQEKKRRMMYMKRLDPFLQTMEQYGKVLDIFVNTSEIVAFIWGPMKFILLVTNTYSEAFHSVLDAYQEIGEQIPLFKGYEELFSSSAHMKSILVLIYRDILEFHREAIRHFKQRRKYQYRVVTVGRSLLITFTNLVWKQLFQATWRGFTAKIRYLKDNLGRHKRLIENHATIVQFEEIQHIRDSERRKFEVDQRIETDRRRLRVIEWLLPFNTESLQEQYTETRSICSESGRWLINDSRFQNWFSPNQCLWPSLWISGIPGAGKTILSSVVVQEARSVPQTFTIFFYCKYGDPSRNTFICIAKSLLAQLLMQHDHLLQLLYEKASMSGELELMSKVVAKELLRIALNSCGMTYIILDGLDECDRANRKDIATWFQSIVDEIHLSSPGTIRCLFVSQDDGIARKDLSAVPTIKITPSETMNDLAAFAGVWHKRIEGRFGVLRGNTHIANIIIARSQGMFLFAKLLAQYLFSQSSRENLLRALDPARLPVKLDDAYSRILQRITEDKSDDHTREIWRILGWIACAPRLLRWREIQAAASLDLENQEVEHGRRYLDSPKDLFASLIEFQPNDTVELIHGTTREYLIRSDVVIPNEIHFDLSLTSVGFLSFPELDIRRTKREMEKDVLEGRLAFYDYASACWAIHLQAGLSCPNEPGKLATLVETLETFIDLHWSETSKSLVISKTTHESLEGLSNSESYDKIAQAVGWSKRQLSRNSQGPSEDETLDLREITMKLRAALENFQQALGPDEKRRLTQYYGDKWFKCPRINCFFYHEGFDTAVKRDGHIARHERPFMCIVNGCHMTTFGCVTESALKTHLFDYHGIDLLDSEEFPEPPKATTSSSQHGEKLHCCSHCPKKFTRKFNLRSHLRTHVDEKPFACSSCEERFTRKSDCVRHERGHGEKKLKCSGQLEDGTSWGCKAAFGRADKLASHLRTKTGRQCIRPLIMQELKNGRQPTDGNGLFTNMDLDADTLLSAGNGLPTFNEFLQLCGLSKSVLGSH